MNKSKLIMAFTVILFTSSVLSGCAISSTDSSSQIKQSTAVREVKTLNVAEYSVLGPSIQRFEKILRELLLTDWAKQNGTCFCGT